MGLRDDQHKSQINGSKTKKKIYSNKTTLKSDKKSIFQKTSKKNNVSNPKYWVLPNRKKFIEWIDKQFDLFKYSNRSKLQESDFFPHQQLIKNYLQMDSPYRGILLYHSLGSGKSCSSILTAENFIQEKKIIVMLPASLEKNYIEELKKCGSTEIKLDNHWTKEYMQYRDPDTFYRYPKTIDKFNGFWKINKKLKSNYQNLGDEDKKEINFQIEELIKKNYKFIHYNGLRIKNVEDFEKDKDFFNNKVIIVDEIHNLISMMVGNGVIGNKLYKMMMEAQNSRFIFLSGTPMINYPFELSILFNLLRGYIKTYNLSLYKPNHKWDNDDITRLLRNHPDVDMILPDNRNNKLTFTKNNSFFSNKFLNDSYEGVSRNNFKNLHIDFLSEIKSLLKSEGYLIKGAYEKDFTCFPEIEDDFNSKFVHPLKLTVRNGDIFRRRILGTVSYFKPESNSLIPSIKAEHLVKCQMSGHQTLKYIQLRSHEIEREINRSRNTKKKKKDTNEKENACFRVFSRQCCNFVFPDDINRPFPTDNSTDNEDIFEMDVIDSKNFDNLDAKNKRKIMEFEIQKQQAFEELDNNKEEYLSYNNLGKYSQKFVHILDNIKKSEGTSFVYSQFRSLEGIGIFALVLEANGYAQFRIRKNIHTKEWEEYFMNEDDKSKTKFAYYTGTESWEEKEIIKKVFNNDYQNLPSSFKKEDKDSVYNLYGEKIKILLATSSAAEGINLRNVRQVHIVESYWNPIRIQQVKGRAVRYKSHIQLPEDKRNVEIFQYLSILDKKEIQNVRNVYRRDKGLSSDESVQEIADKKRNISNSFLKLIKETSIDCNLNNSGSEKLRCYNFGQYHTEYSFFPDINMEVEDINRGLQIKSKKIEGRMIKFKSKFYILNKENNDIYDFESFKNGRNVKVGILEKGKINFI